MLDFICNVFAEELRWRLLKVLIKLFNIKLHNFKKAFPFSPLIKLRKLIVISQLHFWYASNIDYAS
jgi:hypothetical protein